MLLLQNERLLQIPSLLNDQLIVKILDSIHAYSAGAYFSRNHETLYDLSAQSRQK